MIETKFCCTCKINKETILFYKSLRTKDGFRANCKECVRLANKKFKKIHKKKILIKRKQYMKAKPWYKILANIRQRCNNPKDPRWHRYGGRNIKNYLTQIDIEYLWKRDKAWELKEPSIDRKNVNKDYTLDNCQFIEMTLNRVKDR